MSAPDALARSMLALALLGFGATTVAQDHSQHQMPATASKATPATKPAKKPAAKPAAKKPATKAPAPAAKSATAMDHAAMGHDMGAMKPAPEKKPAATRKPVPKKKPAAKPSSKTPAAMDHAAMGHDMGAMQPAPRKKPAAPKKPAPGKKPAAKSSSNTPPTVDHSAIGHDMDAMPETPQQPMDHSRMDHASDATPQAVDHAAMGHDMPIPPAEPRTSVPPVTDADRIAAFPDVAPHEVHDNDIHSFMLLDRLEAWKATEGAGMEWEGQGWLGTDLNRLWLRSEGERLDGHTESADLEVLYGRSVARWWDVVAGIRHDFKPGASQDFAAIGVMGLAPQKFEVEATAYLGTSGQTAFRIEIERDLLLTNRLILQPLVEVNLHGKDDPRRRVGSGLSTFEAGLRMRYEITRKFAPYIGIVHERAFGGTADYRRADGEDGNDTRLVAGVRIWF